MSRILDKIHIVYHEKTYNPPISNQNWYSHAAAACEEICDAIIRKKRGLSRKVTKVLAAKFGAASTSAGIFSIAALVGTASTGTAISSLSGAAFTSAALAWIGGSVFLGSILFGVASISGGIGAALGAGWVYHKFIAGKERMKTEFSKEEQNLIDACLSLAIAFRKQEDAGERIDPILAKEIYGEALKPLCENLCESKARYEKWPVGARARLKKAIDRLNKATDYLVNSKWAKRHPNVTTGIVSAVLIQLLSDNYGSFDENELLVLDALRRSTNELDNHSTVEELAEYIKGRDPVALVGLRNNIKGIYHELRFAKEENLDGDNYVVELFESTNHPGADVIIRNLLTGETKEVQLKATNYLSYIKEHNEKYPDTEVLATEEVAFMSDDLVSTGITNDGITTDVEDVFDSLDGLEDGGIVMSSMSTAAMFTLARNTRVLLRREKMTSAKKKNLIEGGVVSAGIAGVVALIIG